VSRMRDYVWDAGVSSRSGTHGWMEIVSPQDPGGPPVARCALGGAEAMERLTARSVSAQTAWTRSSRRLRGQLLSSISEGIERKRAEFVQRILEEAGKPISFADVEVSRAVSTFRVAADEARALAGRELPLDSESSGEPFGRGIQFWVPRGPVLAIGPFNFPLNLLAHKVAPALAAGCTVALKPPPQAPGPGFLLHEVFVECAKALGVSEDVFQVFQAEPASVEIAVKDPRFTTLSFTGSDRVGWKLRDLAQRKKVLLELGGNAAVIIAEDADLDRAALRCAFGAFAYAGQICISVQRIFVQENVREAFLELFVRETLKLPVGDPAQTGTVVGPVIDAGAANRIENWIERATKSGARALVRGSRQGQFLSPTILLDVPESEPAWCEEVFGPLACVQSFRTFPEAIDGVNRSRYGLQAGVFTRSLENARLAAAGIEAGGVWVNEVPTVRVDSMPYGGVKDSGLGREGLKSAIEEFSEPRVVIGLL